MSETPQTTHEAVVTLSASELDFLPFDIPSSITTLEEAVEVLKNDIVMSMFVSQMVQDRILNETEEAIVDGRDMPNVEPERIAYRAANMTQSMMSLVLQGAEDWTHRDDESYLYGEAVVTELLNKVLADIHEHQISRATLGNEAQNA